MTRRAIDEHDVLGDFFDRRYRAADGDYHRYAFSYGRRKIDDRLRQALAAVEPGGSVLDVGCGTGEQLRRCADLGFRVAGVEPAARLRAAARRAVPEAEVVDGLSWRLPFADSSFDFAIAIEVLRYLETSDVEASLAELARVLRPGGWVFLTLVNRWATDGYWIYHRGQRLWAAIRRRPGPLHCEFSSPRQIRARLRAHGFADVEAVGRMTGALRWFYKLGIGPTAARRLEPVDERLSRRAWTAPFAGHLVAVARRPISGAADQPSD